MGFLKSKSNNIQRLPEFEKVAAKFKITKVLPSPETEEETATIFAFLLMKVIFDLIFLTDSESRDLGESITTT